MKQMSKHYYLNNGRLDLSLLDEPKQSLQTLGTSTKEVFFPYMDEQISNILEEMGRCFLEEQKN